MTISSSEIKKNMTLIIDGELYQVVEWFMDLPTPGPEQAGLVSVIVGAGAAWFGLYVNSTSTGQKKES